jgi:hypothetical protein
MAKTITTATTTPAIPPRVSQRVMRQADRTTGARKGARPAPPAPVEPDEEVTLKPRTVKLIDGIRPGFRAHVTEFARFHSKAEDLAPPFMRAYAAYQADTGASFVSFVRFLDPDVPADREGYKAHTVYMAADYLRRLVAQPEGETVEDADRPAGMSEAFVRLLAAIVALIPGNQVERLWGVIGSELKWSERRVTTLRTQVEQAEPLLESHVERNALVVDSSA